MYRTEYNESVKAWLVINTETRLPQSSWNNRLDALCAARDLNWNNSRELKNALQLAIKKLTLK